VNAEKKQVEKQKLENIQTYVREIINSYGGITSYETAKDRKDCLTCLFGSQHQFPNIIAGRQIRKDLNLGYEYDIRISTNNGKILEIQIYYIG
jgi:hypothetical protein